MLELVKQQHRDMEKAHREEIKRTKDDLTQQLEEKWKERLKYVHLRAAIHHPLINCMLYV